MIRIIEKSNSIAILSHIMPDGDNIGSCLGLYNALKKTGKNVSCFIDDEIPIIYRFLSYSDRIQQPNCSFLQYDLIIVLDCGDIDRLGKSRNLINDKFIINIDHHITNTRFGDINLVDHNAAATGELVYELIKSLAVEMDLQICECLYTAISTDTGHFQYSNTTSKTHQIVGDLIKKDVNSTDMYRRLYQSNSKEKVMLIARALQTLEFYFKDQVSCITLTKDDISSCGAKDEDTDGIINFGRDIRNVEVSIFLREKSDNTIKVGLRSNKYIDVAKIASIFGGGGHVRAAGLTIYSDLISAKQKVLEEVKKEILGGVV